MIALNIYSALQNAGLVDIQEINSHIVLDIRYATDNNFVGQKVYDSSSCYFRRAVALRLDGVQKELENQGLGLKIWDGYRPVSVQKKLWAIVPDSRYVAPPSTGSRHSRGCAVDLTIIDGDGNELIMPTGFDCFTQKAHADYMNLPQEAIANRRLLRDVMVKHDFVGLSSEWWHFDYKDWQQYDLLDSAI